MGALANATEGRLNALSRIFEAAQAPTRSASLTMLTLWKITAVVFVFGFVGFSAAAIAALTWNHDGFKGCISAGASLFPLFFGAIYAEHKLLSLPRETNIERLLTDCDWVDYGSQIDGTGAGGLCP